MARGELWYQSRILASVEAQGGCCRKWASQWQVGVPDLVMALPGIGGILAEVKLVRVNTGWTERAIALTDIQRETCRDFAQAGMPTVVLVVVKEPRTTALHLASIEDTHITPEHPRVLATTGCRFDMLGLLVGNLHTVLDKPVPGVVQ